MSHLEPCGYDRSMKRHLFLLELSSPKNLPSQLDVRSPHFGCLIAWDATGAAAAEVAALVTPLIKAGAVYFSTWGGDCERVHDIVDELDPYSGAGTVIMTTWHRDSLEEALWFFLNCTWPDDYFERTFRSALAISIGSSRWAETIRAALQNPKAFSKAHDD